MRPPHRILNRQKVHRLAAEHLQAHLKFKAYQRKTPAQVLWSLLLAAAARITSLSDACQRLDDVPSNETARKALLAILPDYATLQRQLNHAERLLRSGVLWRKNAFGCHSESGCRFVEPMLTVVQTLRLQPRPVLDYLYRAVLAHRFGSPAPALLTPQGN